MHTVVNDKNIRNYSDFIYNSNYSTAIKCSQTTCQQQHLKKTMLSASFDTGISIPLRNGQGTGLGRQQDLPGSHG